MYTAQDATSTGGTVYGVYLNLNDSDTTRWGIYEAGGATNYFAGNVGIGTSTPSTFKLEMAGSIGPSADDTYDLGSDTRRWRDVYVGPASLHIGESGDDVTLSYDTVNDRLSINKGVYIDGDAIFNSGTQLNGVDYTWPGADGSNGYILTTDGSGALTWIDPGTLPNNDVWQRNLGAVAPLNITDDILSGATATSSAIVRIPGLTNQNAWFNLGTGNLGIGTTNPVHKLELASGTTAAEGIGFGTDVELYRSTTNTLALASGDSFNIISGALQIAGTSAIDSSRNANFASSVTLGGDAVLSRGAANRFDLASGDSLNIVSGNLQIAGTTAIDSSRNASFATSLTLGGDAVLSRGAANRFDIASGDSLNLVSGNLQIGGTNVITSGRLVLAADGLANAPGFAFASDATNGMFLAGTDQLAFSTAGTESLRILANGNVGIADINPTEKLVVNGNIAISGTNGSFIASIGDASPHNDPVYTFTGDTDTGMFRAATNQLGFSTSGNEAMRIIANGNVGIGITNPGAMFVVDGTVRFSDLTTGTSNLAVCMNSATGEIIQSSALNCTTSSQRYKSNIQDLDAGLAQILELRPRSYVRDSSGLTEIGLIAEEVENIDSRLVFYNEEGLVEGVHYENFTALLAKGIQELDAKIATLNASIPEIVASSSAEFDLGENIEADFAAFDFTSISSDLTVLGTTTLREASITDTLAVGAGELVITSSSINTLSETLELQSLAQAPVSIMAGAVTINTDGTVTFAENVEFQKNVAVAGEFTTSQLNIQKSAPTLLSDTEMSASSSAGTAYIKAGQTIRSIQSPLVKSDSLIYITPLSDTLGTTPFISEQKEQDASTSASFTVTIKEEVSEDIHFNFLIIN
jgi:hypothetical protein